jgi:hypothetical protein
MSTMQGAGGGGDDNRKRKMPEVPEDKPLLWIEELELLLVEHLAEGALGGSIPTKHDKQMTWCINGMKVNNEKPGQGGFKYKTQDAKKKHLFVQRAIKRLADVRRLLGRCNGMNLEEQDADMLMSFLPAAIARREEMYAALQDDSDDDEGEDPNGPC